MVAGCGAFFEQQFGLSFWIGSITCSLACYGIFSYKYKGLETLNSVLVPFIILGILMIGFGKYDPNAIISTDYTIHPGYVNNWFLSSLIYTSYNSIVLVPIIMAFRKYNFSNKKKAILSALTALSFVIIGVFIYRIINIYYPNILAYELPNVKLASLLGKIQESFYGVVVLTAILTTAVSSGFAFLEMRDTHYDIKALLICASAVLFAKIGFSELVNTTFPLFGYLGLFQIIAIIITGLKKDKERENNE